MSKKIKNKENCSASDDDFSKYSSDESTRAMRNQDSTDSEPEESDEDACTSEASMPKLPSRSNDAGAHSEDDDDGVLTSEGSTPKFLLRKDYVDENFFEREQKWEILTDTDDEMRDLQDAKISKDKVKTLGLEMLLSLKIGNEEWATPLCLTGVDSSKSLGKREKTTKNVAMSNDEKAKWKTKAGMLETKESARTKSMELPQFAKHR